MTLTASNQIASTNEQSSDLPLRCALVVFAVAMLLYLPLPIHVPIAGTEGHRALTAHQMVQSGEWLIPRLFGRVYLAKPPLHYWIIASFERVGGHATPFVWRMPSAVEGALLASVLSLFASRWFGRIGGWVSGFSYLALIMLWNEDRSAEIDVSNTLAATLAALCIIELHFGKPKWRWAWIVVAGLAIGASLMVKGPAGLTIILGTLAWACIEPAIARVADGRERLGSNFGFWILDFGLRMRRAVARMGRASVWLPPLIGFAVLGLYAAAAYHYLRAHGMAMDLTGVQEGTQDMHPHDWSVRRAAEWILLAPTMFLYALPVSLALPMSFMRPWRGLLDPRRARIARALAASVLAAWMVCFITGMHLPRYAFVTAPLLCPLAGSLAAATPLLDKANQMKLRMMLGLIVLILGIAAAAFAAVLLLPHRSSAFAFSPSALLPAFGLLALPVAIIAALRLRSDWRALWLVPLLLLLLSAPFAVAAAANRVKRSCLEPAALIRKIAGPEAQLATCAMVLDQPDLFYYTYLPTHAYDGDELDWHVIKPGTWCVLEEPEIKHWQSEERVAKCLGPVTEFTANKNKGFLVQLKDAPAP